MVGDRRIPEKRSRVEKDSRKRNISASQKIERRGSLVNQHALEKAIPRPSEQSLEARSGAR